MKIGGRNLKGVFIDGIELSAAIESIEFDPASPLLKDMNERRKRAVDDSHLVRATPDQLTLPVRVVITLHPNRSLVIESWMWDDYYNVNNSDAEVTRIVFGEDSRTFSKDFYGERKPS